MYITQSSHKSSIRRLSPSDIIDLTSKDSKVVVLDCRPSSSFAKSHVCNAVHVPVDGQFAVWCAYLVDPTAGEKIILVAEPGKEQEAVVRLSRTGLDNCIGYLEGGFDAWIKEGMPVESTSIVDFDDADDFNEKSKNYRIIDVRNPGEWADGVLEKADL